MNLLIYLMQIQGDSAHPMIVHTLQWLNAAGPGFVLEASSAHASTLTQSRAPFRNDDSACGTAVLTNTETELEGLLFVKSPNNRQATPC